MSDRAVQPSDDDHLVRRAREGDHDAYASLVRRHQDEMYTLALRLTSDAALAADVTQEAFIRAWRGLPKFRGEAAFSTWLHRIVVNTAWTQRRRVRRRATWQLAEDTAITGDEPQEAGERVDLRARLGAALRELPLPLRMVVVLKDVYGWPHRDIASHLGISVSAAKVRLHRARKRLRLALGEDGR